MLILISYLPCQYGYLFIYKKIEANCESLLSKITEAYPIIIQT